MKRICTSLLLTALFLTTTLAQERPFRIGLKFGYPHLAGFNVEYVTPLLNKKLSGDVDLTYFGLSSGNASVGFMNLAIGANYYFLNEGRGLYGGVAFGRTSFSASEDLTSNGLTAAADATVGVNKLNLKIGGKHGGLFYFRWELGYSVAFNNPKLVVSADFPDGSHQEESIDFPISGAGAIADIGFGFSF